MKAVRARLRRAASAAVRSALLGATVFTYAQRAHAQTDPAVLTGRPDAMTVSTSALAEVDEMYLHRDKGDNLQASQERVLTLLGKAPRDARLLWRLGRGRVRLAEKLSDRGKKIDLLKAAEAALKDSVARDPNAADAHFWLGLAYGRRGEAQGVLHSLFLVDPIKKEMQRVLELDPRHGGAYHVQAEMYRQLPRFAGGSLRKSAELFDKAISMDPDHTAHYVPAAKVFLQLGDKEKARAVLQQALKVAHPDDPAEGPSDLAEAKSLLDTLR